MKKIEVVSISIILSFFTILIIGIFKNGILLFGDTTLTYHFGHKFFSFNDLYLWDDYFQSGVFDFNKFQGFYLKKLIYLVNIIVNDLYLFSYLYFFITLFLYTFTFYFIIKEILKTSGLQKNSIVISLILSLFSVFNGIFVLYAGQILYIMALIMANIFLIFFIKNINYIKENQQNNYLYIIIMAIAISEASIYLQIIILLMYAFFILSILNYKFMFKYKYIFLNQILLVSFVAVLLNFEWIIVLLDQSIRNGASVGELINYDVNLGWAQAESISNNIYIRELLRLKSYSAVFNQIPGLFYFIGYAPIFIILASFLMNIKKQKDSVFLSLVILLVISIFLSYGIHPITKDIYRALWDNIPFFNTFRTILKFSFILLYTAIILLAIVLSKTKNIKVFTIILLLVLFNVLFSISYYTQPEFAKSMEKYKIPDYYFEVQAKNFDNTYQKIGNNLLLPQVNWMTQYEWAPQGIDSMNIFPYFYGKGNLVNGAQYYVDTPFLFNDYFNFISTGGFAEESKKLLRLRNVRYVTYQNDIRLSNKPGNENIIKIFNTVCSGTEYFGELYFCKVNNSIFTPVLYIGNEEAIVKKQPHINQFQETPTVLLDLSMLGLSRNDTVMFFETNKLTNKINPIIEIYPSMRPYVTQNCYNNTLPCNIYIFENIPEGDYNIYYRPYTIYYIYRNQYIQKPMNQGYEIKIYDGVDSGDLNKIIAQGEMRLPKKYDSITTINYLNGNNSYLGKSFNLGRIFIKGNNVVIKTINDYYFSSYGRYYLIKNTAEKTKDDKDTRPRIEFKEVNPTKYRVIVHKARNNFSLFFAKNFHKGWNAYVVDSKHKVQNTKLDDLDNYKILDGNEEDQASREELEEFIKNGWVSYLGDKKEKEIMHKKYKNGNEYLEYIEKYKIDFISKNIQDTIQNDNLEEGHFYETWLKQPIDNNSNHIMANGYANSWIIDPKKICNVEGNNKCIQNSDGTYDLTIVVEFLPQRLFYAGLLISGITLFGCLGYLLSKCKKIKKFSVSEFFN